MFWVERATCWWDKLQTLGGNRLLFTMSVLGVHSGINATLERLKQDFF